MKLSKLKVRISNLSKENAYLKFYYNEKIESNLVLVESKQGEDLAGNMFYTLQAISKLDGYRIKLAVTPEKVSQIQKLLKNYGIQNVEIVIHNSLEYYKTLATAKYLFNDTSFPKMFIKKEGQVYTNTWHGTPLKQMGKDVDNRKYAIGNVKRNFMFADYLVYPNNEMKEKMVSAYGLQNLYKGTVLNAGYPRNAVFFNREAEQETRKKLKLDNKQVIVYMPTWRGIMTKREQDGQTKDIMKLLNYIDKNLRDDQVFYVKMHVLVQQDLNLKDFKHIRNFPTELEAYEVLNVADTLITDYSSVFFDFANTEKNIILYTYDEEEYTSLRGFYYSLDELPFPKVYTPEELLEAINKPKEYDDTEFLKRFCTYDNANAAKALVDYIFKGIQSPEVIPEKLQANGKNNVLIYCSTLPLNGITSSLIALMNVIDIEKENIYFSFRQQAIKRNPLRLNKLPKKTDIFPIFSEFIYSYKELIAKKLFYNFSINTKFVKKHLDRLYKRETLRLFGNTKFDKVIHFTGYEKEVTGFLERFDAKRAIFVHSNMVSEVKSKGNQHYKSLKEAYNEYDRVVAVSEDIVPSIKKISGRDDNIVIVENAHDYESILRKKEEEIKFDEKTVANVSEKTLKKMLDKNYLKFINIGRFSPEKGQKRLIDAFEQFYKKNNNAILIIIGGYGKLFKELQEYIKKLECRYNVILIKDMSNPFPVLKRCDLFIMSSFYEALGMVILEANTCGIPCISTDIKGPRTFMKEHNGRLVDNSEAGILEGMNEFVEGKIKCMKFDAKSYNQKIKEEYESIFD